MQSPTTLNPTFRMPADFEPQEALVFGCGQMVKAYPQTFVDFVRLLHERVSLFGVISERHVRLAQLLLSVSGLPKNAVEFLVADTSSMWVRDYSPVGAFDENGRRIFLNFDFGHMTGRNDVELRRLFEQTFAGKFVDVSLTLEGGNLLSNGSGFALTSQTVVGQNAERCDRGKVGKILSSVVGADQWATVPSLNGEPTGHVDLLAAFLGATRLLVGQVDAAKDPVNSRSLDEIAATLNGLKIRGGELEVVRIPMPAVGDEMFRSYTNLLIVNGVIVVPTYPTVAPETDLRVLDFFSELMPDHEVFGLDCSNVVRKGGSLHCMTMNVAKM